MTNESKIRALAGAATLALAAAFVPALGHAATASHDLQAGQVEEGANYDLKPETVGDCKVGAECVVKLTATTKGDYHVNDTYPFKLTLAAAGIEFHGSAGATFAGADFERQGKTVGVMTIKFKPSAKGQVTLTGKYKVCFCTDQTCAPSVIDISIPVNVK